MRKRQQFRDALHEIAEDDGGKFYRTFSVKHMLKDMQIASRLGLASRLELGVSWAARDRLLEQMQRGHGDDDYSVVVQKYFPEAGLADGAAENGLELFESRAGTGPGAGRTSGSDGGEPRGSAIADLGALGPAENGPIPAADVLPAPVLAPLEEVAASEIQAPAVVSDGFQITQTEAIFSEEPLPDDESEQHRGFFSRLLRR